MVGWHHQLNGHELEQTPGDREGQGSLVCCSSWDTMWRLNNNKPCWVSVSLLQEGKIIEPTL